MINIYFSYTVNSGWVVCSGKPAVNYHHVQQVYGHLKCLLAPLFWFCHVYLFFLPPRCQKSCLFK